jgi:glutaredoxin 3
MTTKRKIEVFTAGCGLCDETVKLVRGIACASCDVEVLDMNDATVIAKAKSYGIRRVPSVVVDGRLADCCAAGGPDEASLRAAGIGSPLP